MLVSLRPGAFPSSRSSAAGRHGTIVDPEGTVLQGRAVSEATQTATAVTFHPAAQTGGRGQSGSAPGCGGGSRPPGLCGGHRPARTHAPSEPAVAAQAKVTSRRFFSISCESIISRHRSLKKGGTTLILYWANVPRMASRPQPTPPGRGRHLCADRAHALVEFYMKEWKTPAREHRNLTITSSNKGFSLLSWLQIRLLQQPLITCLKLASLALLSKSRIKIRRQNVKRHPVLRKRLSFEGSSVASHFTSLVYTNICNQI